MHDSSPAESGQRAETCDYCGTVLAPPAPGALYERRFCSDEHKNAYWTDARKVGDAALRAVKAIRGAA